MPCFFGREIGKRLFSGKGATSQAYSEIYTGYVQNFLAQVKLLIYGKAPKENEGMLIVSGRVLLIPVWFECPAQFIV